MSSVVGTGGVPTVAWTSPAIEGLLLSGFQVAPYFVFNREGPEFSDGGEDRGKGQLEFPSFLLVDFRGEVWG
ncbi:MAG: hypothetical protein IPL39_20415 [Opitutaceae bacterium]|nr:hypothetical protein [Opitutaceae bacterium]